MIDQLQVVRADAARDPALRVLLEFYFYDMAEWFRFDQQPYGGYVESTEAYWSDDYDVYFLELEGLPIGFSIVGSAAGWQPDANARDMTEFFVIRRHRRSGVGRAFASRVWDMYPGTWLVRVFQANQPALPFWRGAVSDYSNGEYVEEVISKPGGDWSHFTLQSSENSSRLSQ